MQCPVLPVLGRGWGQQRGHQELLPPCAAGEAMSQTRNVTFLWNNSFAAYWILLKEFNLENIMPGRGGEGQNIMAK